MYAKLSKENSLQRIDSPSHFRLLYIYIYIYIFLGFKKSVTLDSSDGVNTMLTLDIFHYKCSHG